MGEKDKMKYAVEKDAELVEKVIKINRVTKVVKGGKRLAFRALVITGNRNGEVGIGLGKSKEVPLAIRKAVERSKRNSKKINIVSGTLSHEVKGHYGSSKVIIMPAKPGTGVIAGGAVRVLLEAVGLRNVVAKSFGSRNPFNVAYAALNGLLTCRNKKTEEKLRNKKLSVIIYKDQDNEEISILQESNSDSDSNNNSSKSVLKNKVKEDKSDKKSSSKTDSTQKIVKEKSNQDSSIKNEGSIDNDNLGLEKSEEVSNNK